MATIEPRLIHLLNESTATPKPNHAELPPIKGLLPRPIELPHLPPIDHDGNQRGDGLENQGPASSSQPALPSLSLYPNGDEVLPGGVLRREDSFGLDRSAYHHVSSQDLRMILDDTAELDDAPMKKRPVKEDFVQLPQPHKKQKASSHQNDLPPIIVGLVEPPLNAARFPPIASGPFEEHSHSEPSQALSLATPTDPRASPSDENTTPPSPAQDIERTPTGRIKRRAVKPRRKWSEQETNNLLLGVHRHGVGRWTDILEDREYKFNDRTAGDLKDRFRTCCPDELRENLMRDRHTLDQSQISASPITDAPKPRKGLMAENILNDPETPEESEKTPPDLNDSEPSIKQKKSRAHRKKLEDLVELGIQGPFKKSQRRGRRPFSEQDDREILLGFEIYGPQWTKIQRDPQFNLSTRQPTDLRDRLRNKYPEKFPGSEKTATQGKEPVRSNNLLEPSVHMNIGNSLDKSKSGPMDPQMNRTSSREDIPRWPLVSGLVDTADSTQASANVFWSEATGTALQPGGIGEMDISRLLLDDNHSTENLSADRRAFGS